MDLDLIFKAYDIRGRTDNGELDEDVARRVGAAFARFTGATPSQSGMTAGSPPRRCETSSSTVSPARE